MVQVLGFLRQVGCGIDSGEFFEVVNKVRLIEITAAGGHVRPVTIISAVNHLQHLLNAAYPAEKLRRKAYFTGEKVDEATRADADLVGDIGHGRCCMDVAEQTQREADGAMPLQRLESLRHKAVFDDLEFLFRKKEDWKKIAQGVLFKKGSITENADKAEESTD